MNNRQFWLAHQITHEIRNHNMSIVEYMNHLFKKNSCITDDELVVLKTLEKHRIINAYEHDRKCKDDEVLKSGHEYYDEYYLKHNYISKGKDGKRLYKVTAVQFNGNVGCIKVFPIEELWMIQIGVDKENCNQLEILYTDGTTGIVSIWDWIVRETNGYYYPMKEQAFNHHFEPIA